MEKGYKMSEFWEAGYWYVPYIPLSITYFDLKNIKIKKNEKHK